MKLIILTTVPFPYGMAGTNRILSYSKGIVELGHKVLVIVLCPSNEKVNAKNKYIKGQINGVSFVYAPGTTTWPEHGKGRLQKLFYLIKGLVVSYSIIKKEKKENNIKAILLYSNSTLYIIYFFIVSNLQKLYYLQEKSEYPFILRRKGFLIKKFAKLYINNIYKLFDGMIIETKTLISFYKPKLRKKAKILCVPMTVDPKRFICSRYKRNNTKKIITYCGNMRSYDGVFILIKAFKLVSENFDTAVLFMIGDTYNNPDFDKLKQLVDKLNLQDKIIFTGRVDSDLVPKYLCKSDVLVLASPISQRSTGSLPSKLGEYLSTGKPVVVTKVGEIPKYLSDGINAFLAKPGDQVSFANKLMYVLSDYEKAKKAGLNGRETALKYFNYLEQSKRIINFINGL